MFWANSEIKEIPIASFGILCRHFNLRTIIVRLWNHWTLSWTGVTGSAKIITACLLAYMRCTYSVRSLQDDPRHQSEDVEKFQQCCVESRQYGDEYCEYYLERRPMSSSHMYDEQRPGNPSQNSLHVNKAKIISGNDPIEST